LDQHVEDLHGAPQTHPLAGGAQHHLVQVPTIGWRSRRAIAEPNFSTQRRTVSYEMSSPRDVEELLAER
jgi:hypothetical protein